MRAGIVILPEDRWWAAEPKWRAAEEYGFDHAWTYDHLGWRSLVDGPWFSAVPTLTAAAMVTSRIRLGTFVASPVARHPVPFARELITLDDVSDGRFVLGVGAGVDNAYYDAQVIDAPKLTTRQRVDRFTEFTEALDGLLMTDRFDYSGEYYTAVGARNLPGTVQRPRLPFVVAANGPRTMTLAARFGAGWVTTGRGGTTIDEWWQGIAELVRVFDERLEAAGRDSTTIERHLSLDAAPVYSLSSVDAFRDGVERARALGFTDVIAHWPRSTGPYEGHESVLEQVVDTVLPELREE
ncbi:LLM class flavin-dependent oxidoreductase [Amycolatopsis jiangsuensis]|uniref:Alkanesulfonate monooxygenase SsuD/methylene tetrahydromethanopterin reductase-like flavin-dependent oxidoreductase (Luciferase family) n=1 Tax=Amycolatopsis jiangsuensis TaxID=1181879 RepID=A0A840IYV7_9PSEU|nr:LLM class flavin-dependent oxidoreductase [Amycolatopsis jiangsuensis]MBB4687010.1 alkanesulfonate monooxygenase SsuD/methylene tetrahydromethanopterin reductase-like flavin-dependent oxidoreductase (luciferase family) [Amycolatopsis jiangsuensis]